MVTFIKDNRYKVALGILVVIAIGAAYWYFHGRTKDVPADTPTVTDAVVKQNTTLEVKPKTSKNDNDLEVTQTYKANINGTKVEVPVVTKETAKETAKDGTKAVVTQEIDMTNVINSALTVERKRVEQEYKKNWEIGTGIGSHDGDIYIPVEIQRNYAKDKAIAVEVHVDVDKTPSVSGWEVKHKWKF